MLIITDTAADIMEEEAITMDIKMVSINILFQGNASFDNTPEGFEHFYQMLKESEELPTTSQPSPQTFLSLYEQAFDNDIIVIALSSGLSGTYNSAVLAKNMYESESATDDTHVNKHIYVIDSRQAIIAQRILVEHAVQLRNQGCNAENIVASLEELRDRILVCGVLNTLTYLKKGGRIPASIATVGSILGIKPVVALFDAVVTSIGKARSFKTGKEMLWNEYDKRDIDYEYPVFFGYTRDFSVAESFCDESSDKRGLKNTRICAVGGTIGTHLGPGAVILCFVSKNKIEF